MFKILAKQREGAFILLGIKQLSRFGLVLSRAEHQHYSSNSLPNALRGQRGRSDGFIALRWSLLWVNIQVGEG